MTNKTNRGIKRGMALINEIEKLSSEDILYAMNYPVSELIDCALDRLSKEKREELMRKFDENVILLSNYQGLKQIIKENNINSEEEYNSYLQMRFHH